MARIFQIPALGLPPIHQGNHQLATVRIDARGMKCPLPVLKLDAMVRALEVKPGDTVSMTADCPTFEADLRKWCQRHQKTLLFMKDLGSHKQAELLA